MNILRPPSSDPGASHRAPRPILVTAAKNSTANLARLAISWLVVLTLPPLLVHVLDKPTYATWVLILQIGAYATTFDSGIQMAIARFVARAQEMGDTAYMGTILSTTTALLFATGLLLCLIAPILSMELGSVFHSVPAAIIPQASRALLIIAASLALALPFSALGALYLGLQRNEVNTIAGSSAKIVGAAGAAWAAFHHQGLGAMALWTAAGTLLQPVIYLLAPRAVPLRTLFRIALVSYQTARSFVRFCSSTIASQFGTLIISGLDIPIVVAFDFRAAAYYAIATALSNILIVPHGAILAALMPIASGMTVSNQPQRLGQALLRVTRYSTALLCALALPLFIGMGKLLPLWVGPDYASHSQQIAVLLLAAQFIRLPLAPYAMFGFSAGQQHKMLVSVFGEAVVNLAASLILVRSMGALGVAAGTLIGALVGVALHFFNSMPRTDAIFFSRTQLLWKSILLPIASSLPAACVIPLLRASTSLPVALACIAAAELILCACLLLVNFSQSERAEMIGLIRHLLPEPKLPSFRA